MYELRYKIDLNKIEIPEKSEARTYKDNQWFEPIPEKNSSHVVRKLKVNAKEIFIPQVRTEKHGVRLIQELFSRAGYYLNGKKTSSLSQWNKHSLETDKQLLKNELSENIYNALLNTSLAYTTGIFSYLIQMNIQNLALPKSSNAFICDINNTGNSGIHTTGYLTNIKPLDTSQEIFFPGILKTTFNLSLEKDDNGEAINAFKLHNEIKASNKALTKLITKETTINTIEDLKALAQEAVEEELNNILIAFSKNKDAIFTEEYIQYIIAYIEAVIKPKIEEKQLLSPAEQMLIEHCHIYNTQAREIAPTATEIINPTLINDLKQKIDEKEQDFVKSLVSKKYKQYPIEVTAIPISQDDTHNKIIDGKLIISAPESYTEKFEDYTSDDFNHLKTKIKNNLTTNEGTSQHIEVISEETSSKIENLSDDQILTLYKISLELGRQLKINGKNYSDKFKFEANKDETDENNLFNERAFRIAKTVSIFSQEEFSIEEILKVSEAYDQKITYLTDNLIRTNLGEHGAFGSTPIISTPNISKNNEDIRISLEMHFSDISVNQNTGRVGLSASTSKKLPFPITTTIQLKLLPETKNWELEEFYTDSMSSQIFLTTAFSSTESLRTLDNLSKNSQLAFGRKLLLMLKNKEISLQECLTRGNKYEELNFVDKPWHEIVADYVIANFTEESDFLSDTRDSNLLSYLRKIKHAANNASFWEKRIFTNPAHKKINLIAEKYPEFFSNNIKREISNNPVLLPIYKNEQDAPLYTEFKENLKTIHNKLQKGWHNFTLQELAFLIKDKHHQFSPSIQLIALRRLIEAAYENRYPDAEETLKNLHLFDEKALKKIAALVDANILDSDRLSLALLKKGLISVNQCIDLPEKNKNQKIVWKKQVFDFIIKHPDSFKKSKTEGYSSTPRYKAKIFADLFKDEETKKLFKIQWLDNAIKQLPWYKRIFSTKKTRENLTNESLKNASAFITQINSAISNKEQGKRAKQQRESTEKQRNEGLIIMHGSSYAKITQLSQTGNVELKNNATAKNEMYTGKGKEKIDGNEIEDKSKKERTKVEQLLSEVPVEEEKKENPLQKGTFPNSSVKPTLSG